MRNILPIILLIHFVFCTTDVKSQNSLAEILNLQSEPKVYAATKTNQTIIIDGKLDSAWEKASWSTTFVDIEGENKEKPPYSTRFKMLWDEEHLYIYSILNEPHIWGTLKQKDTIIYHNNDFEIFLKPKLSSPLYYEIEINTLNTIMDLLMPKPYRLGGQAIMHWDAKDLKSAIHVEGTLNNPSDTDQYWAVELAIPYKSLRSFGSRPTPKPNEYWRINFSRVQWQHEIKEGKYYRKKLNDKILPENNWVWSPIGLINMHYPERWGFIHFTENSVSESLPAMYKLEKLAWNIFYLQQIAFKKHKKYTADIKSLEGYDKLLKPYLDKYTIQLSTYNDSNFFYILVKEKNSKYYFTIDKLGNYYTNYE